jgi:L-ascorbate metabolism protein UlaG (beta-lactamase superfamily)
MTVTLTHIDTACFLLDIHGFRIVTDPVFDAPGRLYSFGWGTFSRKSSTPALQPADLGRVDAVLLSHDQHEDNLDRAGRAFLATVPLILSTQPAARRLHGVTPLAEWESHTVESCGLRITATPAQHTGLRLLNPIAGKVVGFVLEWPGQQGGAYYISGDTVFFDGIVEVARRFPTIHTAFLHTGRAGFPYLTGPLPYTFHARDALRALAVLKPRRFIPVHCNGWWHFREDETEARRIYQDAGLAMDVVFPTSGTPVVLAP